jgi:uncharacterized phage protein (TIGR01671 family)
MRQIRFRAWHENMKQYFLNLFIDFSGNIGVWNNEESEIDFSLYPFLVLEQFTGLLDKNGKEIYEGDILRTHEYYGGDYLTPIATIIVSYEICASGSAGFYLPDEVYWNRCEIIGNIHENPELLK